MRIQKFIFLLLIFVMIIFSCYKSKKGSWKTIVKTNPSQKVTIAGFIDENFGITAGYGGTIGYTNDGGKKWNIGNNSSWCRFGLEILNKNKAWTSGNKGHNRITIDGGKNWEALTDFGNMEPNQCRYISFCNDTAGWLGSPDVLVKTSDGGKTWEKIDLPQGIDKILAINLSNFETGYLLDINGIIYKTKDSGKTWGKISLNIDKNNYYFYPSKASSIIMKFMGNHGVIILRQIKPKKQFIALHTNDGGKSWQDETIAYNPPKDAKSSWDYFLFLSQDWSYLTITAGMGDNNKYVNVLKKN